jgi:hypothetical protein
VPVNPLLVILNGGKETLAEVNVVDLTIPDWTT